MLCDPRIELMKVMNAADEALQKATAEFEALPADSPLLIPTALKMHQANATYLTSTVAMLSYDMVETQRDLKCLRERLAAFEAKSGMSGRLAGAG